MVNNEVAVEPDYDLSEDQVYYNFAISCLLSGDLAVLNECATADIERDRGFLSFVPRLDLKPSRTEAFGTLRFNKALSAGKVFPMYTAACGLAGVRIRGILLDTIAHSVGFS